MRPDRFSSHVRGALVLLVALVVMCSGVSYGSTSGPPLRANISETGLVLLINEQ